MGLKLYEAIGALVGGVFAILLCAPSHANLIQAPAHGGGGGGGTLNPPQMAANAGFTTLALNLDFSGATSSSWKGISYDATNFASWLDLDGTDGSKPMHCLNNPGVPSNCADMAVVSDPLDGKGSLIIPYKNSYGVNAGQFTSDGMHSEGNDHTVQGATYPLTAYYQITMRIDQVPTGNQGDPTAAFWVYDSGDYRTAEEFDFLEMYPGPHFDAAAKGFSDFYLATDVSLQQDDTNYHTYSFLGTWDGNTADNPWICWFFDQTFTAGFAGGNGAPVNCAIYNYNGQGDQGIRLQIIANSQGDTTISDYTMYIRDIQVWSCPAWDSVNAPTQGGTCPEPNLTNNGAGGLSYYHP